jgi:hypothetical protein
MAEQKVKMTRQQRAKYNKMSPAQKKNYLKLIQRNAEQAKLRAKNEQKRVIKANDAELRKNVSELREQKKLPPKSERVGARSNRSPAQNKNDSRLQRKGVETRREKIRKKNVKAETKQAAKNINRTTTAKGGGVDKLTEQHAKANKINTRKDFVKKLKDKAASGSKSAGKLLLRVASSPLTIAAGFASSANRTDGKDLKIIDKSKGEKPERQVGVPTGELNPDQRAFNEKLDAAKPKQLGDLGYKLKRKKVSSALPLSKEKKTTTTNSNNNKPNTTNNNNKPNTTTNNNNKPNTTTKNNSNVKTSTAFGKAFRKAHDEGKDTFEFQGKKYHTRMKDGTVSKKRKKALEDKKNKNKTEFV